MALSDDEITAMALEANHENDINSMLPFLQRFAALVAAKEREACARVADATFMGKPGQSVNLAVADAIRAMGKP
jgi:hypothetical protein